MGKHLLIETVGYLVKDFDLDWIDIVVHRDPNNKTLWIVSELSTGHRIGKVETDKTKHHAVADALIILNRLGKEQSELFLEEKRQWVDFHRSMFPKEVIKL